jgi:hypothetical protein
MWNLILVRSEMILVSEQDRCTVYAKFPLGQKSYWTHPMILLADVAHVEYCFGPFGDGVSVGAR